MSRLIAELLTSDHPLLVRTIADFEKASGNAGVDTRLIADITEKAHEVMRSLRVDPADTPGEELYHALNATVQNGQAESLLASSSYVLMKSNDGPISFNVQDVIENAHHELPYDKRSVGHAQRHLRAEIVSRYAEHDRTSGSMIHNLAEMAGLRIAEDESYESVASGDGNADVPYMLAVGDIFTDAFIKLSEDVANVTKDDDGKSWIHIPFGGRPPYEEVEIVQSVGPSPNSAVSFARLGLNSSLMSWLGDDEAGKESMGYLKAQRVNTQLVTQKRGEKSNYYYVLRLGAERTILTKDEKYEYEWKTPADRPDWLYLASISEDAEKLQEDLLTYLEENPDIKLAFQPGTFHFKMDKQRLQPIFRRSHITLMNREEAADMTGESHASIEGLAKALHALGPSIVVITDGPNGSYAYQNGTLLTIPNYPDPAPPYDRTGAGDAFASTIVSALALGESLETALTWAPINSMNVVQHLGAQAGLLSREEIVRYLNDAPEDYKVTEYSD